MTKMAKRLLTTRRSWVQIPALVPCLIGCSKCNPYLMVTSQVINFNFSKLIVTLSKLGEGGNLDS